MVPDADVEGDIAELQKLLDLSMRPRVRDLLQREIRILQEGRSSAPLEQDGTPQALAQGDADTQGHADASQGVGGGPPPPRGSGPVLLQSGRAPMPRHYNPVSSFSWDQDSDKVKVYFFLEGASKEAVELDVKARSVDVRMHDVGTLGRHLRFGVPALHSAVDPDRCTVAVKPNRVTVTLKKRERGHWPDLHQKEDKKPKPALGENKDPMSGIMDLMKNMYEEGDEEMKRTIAKAWSDALGSTANDPLSGGFKGTSPQPLAGSEG